jgi:ParB family chromosome partitioning protein
MIMVISKKNMAERAARAASMAPNIEDRLRHARDMVASHPADDQGPSLFSPAPQPAQPQVPAAPPQSGAQGSALPQEENAQSKPAASDDHGVRMEVVTIELIDQNPFNARKIYRSSRVNELAASIGAHGQETPGMATVRDGRYILAAGHYRLKALKLLGAKTMILMVREHLTDRELYALSYRENAEREAQSSLDNALSWRDLIDKGIYSSESDIAEATSMSLPNVNKTMAALRLSATVLDLVKEDPKAFAMSALYELALYEEAAGSVKALAIAKLVAAGEAGRKEIQEARAQVETPRERKRKETSRQYKIKRDGKPIGLLKEWDSGKVLFEVAVEDPKERAALVAELREKFGISE